jgi:predicted MFS family arabinose efflux permease
MSSISLSKLPASLKQYLIITGNYWGFTLTDGALRMLVVLHFHALGYDALSIAMLFLFYEIFGVITNLVGGWLGAKWGLNRTMNIGLSLQVVALAMLALPNEYLTIVYVMAAQALSGIAKDLNKMSAKSSIKYLVSGNENNKLYQWIALLTGSKNALKGVGFFMGGMLLTTLGFQQSMVVMSTFLLCLWCFSLFALKGDIGKAKNKPKFKEMFSKSASINTLSAARLFLFGARDVWFVVALPVFLAQVFNWDHWWVGGFMASWVIGYGIVQSCAPLITGHGSNSRNTHAPSGRSAMKWAALLTLIPIAIALALQMDFYIKTSLIGGLLVFGAIFAINSSLHSYLIVHFAGEDGVSLDVGFYYMANAMGRLLGTVLSGWVYQAHGLIACLWICALFLLLATLLSLKLPNHEQMKDY